MFQFPGFALVTLCIQVTSPWLTPLLIPEGDNNRVSGGFPHSEIHGSKPIPGSPWLIAGYHVLHRLLLPRHPPNALIALDLIRKKKDLRPQGAAFCCPHPSLPIKSMYVSRPFHAEGTFCAGPMQDRRIWLVYLTWTTSLLLSDPEGSYWHRTPTRARPITPIISLNDVKRLLAKTASDRTSKPCQARLADHVGEVWWSLTDSNR